MDSPVPENSLQLIAILTAIPAVMWALWGEYFSRYLELLKKNEPRFDRQNELARLRLAGLCIYVTQGLVYLSLGPLREAHPTAALLGFATALVLEGNIQSGLDRKVRGSPARANLAVRSSMWGLASLIVYFGSLFSATVLSYAAAQRLGFSPVATLATVLGADLAGIFAGLALTYALGGTFMKLVLPTTPLEDARLEELLQDCFSKAGLRVPDVQVVQTGKDEPGNAFVAGFNSGSGPFTQVLFLTKSLIDQCAHSELEAVVLHEVSHIQLGHLRRRYLLNLGLILASAAASIAILSICYLALPAALVRAFGLVIPIGCFFAAMGKARRQMETQELEADRHSVETLGASPASLIASLRKLDQMSRRDGSRPSGLGHPSTDERIRQLEAYQEEARAAGEIRKAA